MPAPSRACAPQFEPFRNLSWTVTDGESLNVRVACRASTSSFSSINFCTLSSCHEFAVNADLIATFIQCEQVWELVMGFLPWRTVLELRRVSCVMLRRSLAFLSLTNMPCTNLRGLFIVCREDLDSSASKTADAAEVPRSSTAKPNHTHSRMFLGQLRRNGTVRMVEWLLNYVFDAPRGALVSVENHRNANTGRGKGCAWPTIADAATVDRLLLSHHRLFYDRVGGVEGVWLVPQGQEGALRAETDMCNKFREHMSHMPRSSIVVEAPRSVIISSPPAMKSQGPSLHSTASNQPLALAGQHNGQPSLSSFRSSQLSCPSRPIPRFPSSNASQPLPPPPVSLTQRPHPTAVPASCMPQLQPPIPHKHPLTFHCPQQPRAAANTTVPPPLPPQQTRTNCCTVFTKLTSFASPPQSKGIASPGFIEEPESELTPALSVSTDSDHAMSPSSVSNSKVFLRNGSWRHNPYQILLLL